ncbi:bifunctional coenzyme A synthase-like [Oppia nitens]|uniref:bifunctional coenzyme A synthase-like n=1 Tax=Oppia nitens TaxID=1686743 RepID=UPI0023DC3CB4|nr:bifunctional coenzyme A synthase-like [Oppia nitens]
MVEMFKSGLMLLSAVPQLSRLSAYLRHAKQTISNTLYISIDPNLLSSSTTVTSNCHKNDIFVNQLRKFLPQIYAEANRSAPLLDIRVVHHSHYHRNQRYTTHSSVTLQRSLQFTPQVVLINGGNYNEELVRNYLIKEFALNIQQIQCIPENANDLQTTDDINGDNVKVYDNVCLGGTFDGLHNGHKVLISSAQLHCNQTVTIGVTDKSMIKNKKLWQLILPMEKRIEELRKFVTDVDPFIKYNIVPISDPFGPAIVDPSLESIVVSHETVRGGEKINEIRIKNDMKALDIFKIDLLDDFNKQNTFEEQKISSSSLRMRKLGTILREPEVKNLPKRPYIIGLTGGIASGKSSIADKLKSLGAGVINCDLMAHKTYESPESEAFKEIVQHFGKHILIDDSTIDRKKLGNIVFTDKDKLKVLNNIIWPKLEVLILDKINEMKDKYQVIVLEIALLLEAKWDHKVHQIWVTLIDENEAITRLQERNQLTQEEAVSRIESQMTNEDRVQRANVVFCTLWDQSITMDQVKRAWGCLQSYLKKH